MLTLEHKGPQASTSPDPLSNNKFRPLTCTQTGGLVRDEPFYEVISVSLHMSVITQDGHSALMMAAEEGMTEVVSLLLEVGANIDLQNNVHKMDSYCLTITCIMYIISPQNGDSAVILATTCYHRPVLKELVRAGADLNLQNQVTLDLTP